MICVYLRNLRAVLLLLRPLDLQDALILSLQRARQHINFFGGIIRRAKRIFDLFITQAAEQVAQPTSVSNRNVLEKLLVLAAVIEINNIAVYL